MCHVHISHINRRDCSESLWATLGCCPIGSGKWQCWAGGREGREGGRGRVHGMHSAAVQNCKRKLYKLLVKLLYNTTQDSSYSYVSSSSHNAMNLAAMQCTARTCKSEQNWLIVRWKLYVLGCLCWKSWSRLLGSICLRFGQAHWQGWIPKTIESYYLKRCLIFAGPRAYALG